MATAVFPSMVCLFDLINVGVVRQWKETFDCEIHLSVRFIYLTFWVCSLQEDPPAGVSGAPSENNIMVWNAVIFG